MRLFAAFLALAALSSAPAIAQTGKPDCPTSTNDEVTRKLDLETCAVGGRLDGPRVVDVTDRAHRKFKSLIKLRTEFDRELNETLEKI